MGWDAWRNAPCASVVRVPALGWVPGEALPCASVGWGNRLLRSG